MKQIFTKSLAFLIALTLLLSAVTVYAETADPSIRMLSMRQVMGQDLSLRNWLTPSSKATVITYVSAPTYWNVQRTKEFTFQVKVKPATAAAVADLSIRYSFAKLSYVKYSVTYDSTYATVSLTFRAGSTKLTTPIKFYSDASGKLYDQMNVNIMPLYPTAVTLNKTSATVAVGKTVQLTATVTPTNADNKSVTWTSSDTSIATVSSTGLVTGKKLSSTGATITATTVSGGKKATCKVIVSSSTANPTYRALLIGNNYTGTTADLDYGPHNDLVLMELALNRSSLSGKKYAGNITTLKDRSGAQILSAITTIKNMGLDSDDVTFFFYSGHGAQTALTEAGTSIVGNDGVLINVPQLKAALDQLPGTVIVILDSCFSGMFIGKNKGGLNSTPMAYNNIVRSAFAKPSAKGLTTTKYHVITACRKGETSINALFTLDSGSYNFGLATAFIAMGAGANILGNINDTTLNADVSGNNNKIATIKEVYDYADEGVDYIVSSWNDTQITQDMQYFTNNTSYPLFGRN